MPSFLSLRLSHKSLHFHVQRSNKLLYSYIPRNYKELIDLLYPPWKFSCVKIAIHYLITNWQNNTTIEGYSTIHFHFTQLYTYTRHFGCQTLVIQEPLAETLWSDVLPRFWNISRFNQQVSLTFSNRCGLVLSQYSYFGSITSSKIQVCNWMSYEKDIQVRQLVI